VAVWPNSQDGVRRYKGLERSFFVQKLNPDKDFVQVGLDKPASLKSNGAEGLTIGGIYEGHVTGVMEYGVFVRIDDRSGLLHRSKFTFNMDVLAHFSVDQLVRVQLINIRPDGKLELSLPID
jgi:ribosomal protein S1